MGDDEEIEGEDIKIKKIIFKKFGTFNESDIKNLTLHFSGLDNGEIEGVTFEPEDSPTSFASVSLSNNQIIFRNNIIIQSDSNIEIAIIGDISSNATKGHKIGFEIYDVEVDGSDIEIERGYIAGTEGLKYPATFIDIAPVFVHLNSYNNQGNFVPLPPITVNKSARYKDLHESLLNVKSGDRLFYDVAILNIKGTSVASSINKIVVSLESGDINTFENYNLRYGDVGNYTRIYGTIKNDTVVFDNLNIPSAVSHVFLIEAQISDNAELNSSHQFSITDIVASHDDFDTVIIGDLPIKGALLTIADDNQLEKSRLLLDNDQFSGILSELNELRNTVKEQENKIKYLEGLKKDMAVLSSQVEQAITNFITYGADEDTKKLGTGIRAAVVDSYKTAFDKLPETEEELADMVRIANGKWPNAKSESAEEKAKENFKKVYQRNVNMNNSNDNAAITVMAYGLRQKAENRSLDSEKQGLKVFADVFKKIPETSEEWNIVQAIAYSGASKVAGINDMEPKPSANTNIRFIKKVGLPSVYEIKKDTGQLRKIMNLKTFMKLNNIGKENEIDWSVVKEVSSSEFDNYKDYSIENLYESDLNENEYQEDELIKSNNSSAVYIIKNGKKRAILNAKVFERLGFSWDSIKTLSPEIVNNIVEGDVME